jgi:NAD(P)-dependent dehydrogenase (short-subunit alcohol dehydrogenase family)/ribulose-5-phosphate 4-epimerase/fuculose-1-phosphate aldolase
MVLMKHGLVTWGESARESYERTISLVTKAEDYLAGLAGKSAGAVGAIAGSAGEGGGAVSVESPTPFELARGRYVEVAPVLRGALALPSGDPDRPHLKFVLKPLITEEVLKIVDSARGREIALTPPLTSDHLIRTKATPLWIDDPGYGSVEKIEKRIPRAIADFAKSYDEYFRRHAGRLEPGVERLDSMPRVVLMPGLGAVCVGKTVLEAKAVVDITLHTLATKIKVFETGTYEGLEEEHLFDMEYLSLQHRKLNAGGRPLERAVALVTGAVGAIGSGICEELLRNGCHVAATDLPGEALDVYGVDLKNTHGDRAVVIPLDVTDPKSVSAAFDRIVETWGGLDLLVVNAGLAHVSSLSEMNVEDFRKLESVNIEGTLNCLAEAGRHFKLQGTGGDVVLISTKNVFSPGAEFGAYSATKAAAHQLGRIASLELAPIGVRVNMVSPDAVFGEGDRKSGLWAEVGPGRMKARGLDEKGLEEYYQNRNLLSARVTADHVARAVLFFATRQTPTTGATIPVDGGLPDSTPR